MIVSKHQILAEERVPYEGRAKMDHPEVML